MKRVLFPVFFFVTLFVAGSVFASNSFAAAISGTFNNSAGNIDMTVNYTIKDQTGGNPVSGSFAVGPRTIFPFSVANYNTGNYPSITWYTTCNAEPQISMSASSGGYTFSDQDIHCKTINSSIAVTATSCDTSGNGSVSWSVNNIGTGGANIGTFSVYKSLGGSPDSDTSPTNVAYNSSLTSYTLTNVPAFNGLANGTWNIAVKAFPPSPDDQLANAYSVPPVTFTCGLGSGSIFNPSSLNANPSCYSSTAVRVDFNWYQALPGSFNYSVQYTDANGANPGDGSWPHSISISTTDLTYAAINTLSQASTYWWRVSATRVSDGLVLNSASSSFLTPGGCSASYTSPSVNSYPTVVCASTADNGDLTDDASDNYAFANPVWVKIKWDRGSLAAAIQTEVVDLSTDFNFASGVNSYTLPADTTSTQKILMINSMTFPNISITPGTTYFYRVKEKMADNKWYVSAVRPFVGPTYCNNAPSSQVGIAIDHANGMCVGPTAWVYLNWTNYNSPNKFTANTVFKILRGSTQMGLSKSLSFEVQYLDSGSTAWSVVPYWNGLSGAAGTAASVTQILSGCSNPSGIFLRPNALNATSLTGVCSGTNPTIIFRFNDTSTNERNFDLDVSSEPFTGPYSTNPNSKWAYAILPAVSNPNGQTVTFTWSISSPLQYGDANPQTFGTADNLIPQDGVTYYWRVKTNNWLGGDSGYSYNDGTLAGATTPSGQAVVMPVCKPFHDLSAKIDTTTWFDNTRNKSGTSFKAGDSVTVNVIVTNVSSQLISTLPQSVGNNGNLLWFFYNAASSPPAPCAGGDEPSGVTGSAWSLNLPAVGLEPGSSIAVPVAFTAFSAQGSYTAYADVAPSCTFADTPIGGIDPNTTNNISDGATYTVLIDKFFETKGGDVAANGTASLTGVSVGINSASPTFTPAPIYQSDYLLGSRSGVLAAASKPTGYMVTNYPKGFVLSGGVYKYFADRFRSKAKTPLTTSCLIETAQYNYSPNNLYYCDSSVNINKAVLIVNSNPVFFIDGDLNVNKNINLFSVSNPVFIVKGNINVATTVTSMNGIYIARKGFADSDNGGEIPSGPCTNGKLTITGALYVDREESASLDLSRHWGGSCVGTNATAPSDSFIFNPAYIPVINSILATSPVGWQEVLP